tara:strand:+ start:353 stop:532 length:180 start_codon:yes stop_codon:yes gene_type:complete
MTKLEALAMYKEHSKDFIKTCKRREDSVMLREDWNIFVDNLNKGGLVTESQVNRWSNPF